MDELRIPHAHNEISGILGVQNQRILEAFGWEVAFWIASDDRDATEAVALLGRKPSEEWDVVQLKTTRAEGSTSKRTDDIETIARAGGWVYVVGSQYGSKRGPLKPRRHFVARFNEALVTIDGGEPRVQMEVVRRPFLLHRVINDALVAHQIDLSPASEGIKDAFIRATQRRGEEGAKSWRDLVHETDLPINIEGATFLPGGGFVLGLRYPVTRSGNPLLLELEGLDRYFLPDAPPPTVVAVTAVTGVGTPEVPVGIRELDCCGAELHLIVGDLDSKPEKSRLLNEHPQAARAQNAHWVLPLVDGRPAPQQAPARCVRRFGPDAVVEGIALDEGKVWYAHDDELIRIGIAD